MLAVITVPGSSIRLQFKVPQFKLAMRHMSSLKWLSKWWCLRMCGLVKSLEATKVTFIAENDLQL